MNFFSKNKLAISLSFIFAGILCFILFVPPQIGLANSGDFGRIIARFNLYYVSNYHNFSHFYDVFIFGRPKNAYTYNGYFATTSLFIFPALLLNKLFNLNNNSKELFYIYSLSILYVIAYVGAFYILLSAIFEKLHNKYFQYITGAFAVFVFSDSLYIEYFNSFFQEAGFIVCFLLFIGCYLRYQIFFLDAVCLTLVLLSKEQNLLFLLLIIPLFYKYNCNFKRLLILLTCLSIPFYVFFNINTYTKRINAFESLYSGVLHNENVNNGLKILQQLNLNSKYKVFINQDYWSNAAQLRNKTNSPKYSLWQQALEDSSHFKTIKAYWLNPSKLWKNSQEYLKILHNDGPFASNLGNYTKTYRDQYRVWVFTTFDFFLKKIGFMIIINIILLIALLVYYRKSKAQIKEKHWLKNNILILLILNVIVLITIPINIIGAGFMEPVKHFLNAYYLEAVILTLNLLCFFIISDNSGQQIDYQLIHKEDRQ